MHIFHTQHLFYIDLKVEGEARTTSIAIHLNKALCYQKLNDLDEVRHSCNEALTLDPLSVKALYRRAQAHFSLGEIEKALDDFEKCREIEPENKAAYNQITICKQKLKQYRDEEKKRYKNMFAKFSAADAPKDEDLRAADAFAKEKFGEWSESERTHNITKFEEENPDL